jgi:hypothetical protein
MITPARAIPRSLFVFSLFYGGMVCTAGVLGNKQIALGPFSDLGSKIGLSPLGVEAGIFAFLMLVITSSATAEIHDRKTANALVGFGFIPLVMSMALLMLVDWLPASTGMRPEALAATHLLFGQTFRLMLAGVISYGISQTLNVTIFAWLKGQEGAKLLWLRAAVASTLSQIVDTVLFITISFVGVFPIGGIMVGQMIVKVALSILLVPPFIYVMVGFGRWLDGRGNRL